MECAMPGNWGFAEITAVSVGVGMILYAVFLTIGCIGGIR